MNEDRQKRETKDKTQLGDASPRPFIPPNFGRFCLLFGCIVFGLVALTYYLGVERLWWLFMVLVVLGLPIVEGIFGDATDRGLRQLSPPTQRRFWWTVIIAMLALAVFLFIRGIYFYSP